MQHACCRRTLSLFTVSLFTLHCFTVSLHHSVLGSNSHLLRKGNQVDGPLWRTKARIEFGMSLNLSRDISTRPVKGAPDCAAKDIDTANLT
jgi:hypothetical protein